MRLWPSSFHLSPFLEPGRLKETGRSCRKTQPTPSEASCDSPGRCIASYLAEWPLVENMQRLCECCASVETKLRDDFLSSINLSFVQYFLDFLGISEGWLVPILNQPPSRHKGLMDFFNRRSELEISVGAGTNPGHDSWKGILNTIVIL